MNTMFSEAMSASRRMSMIKSRNGKRSNAVRICMALKAGLSGTSINAGKRVATRDGVSQPAPSAPAPIPVGLERGECHA